MTIQVQTVLPWDNPMAVRDAEACIEEPAGCGCGRSDEGGRALVETPAGTKLIARVQADGFVDNIEMPTARGGDFVIPARITRRTEFDLLLDIAGRPHDATFGHVGIGLLPPPGGDASGATLVLRNQDSGDALEPLYFVNLTPNLDATATGPEGVAFFLGVPPGTYTVESDALASCGTIESGWPRPDPDGAVRVAEIEVFPDAITAMSAVQCSP